MPRSLAEPRTTPSQHSHPRAWRVLHASEKACEIVSLAEAQLGVGMRPQVLAREFWKDSPTSSPPSLMTAWHAVRDWRYAFNETELLTAVQIIHAHSFPSAMAAVRGTLPSVYDFGHTLEESAATGSGAGPWMLRSFRVAEQFALSRASAVVTHSEAMRKIVCDRGTAPENVFVVPEPMTARALVADPDWAALHGIDLGYHAVLFALPAPGGIEPALRAFANILAEIENSLLIFELGDLDRENLLHLARDLEVADNIRCISADEHAQALACADVVLAPATSDARRANQSMLRAMAAGKAVVAADVPENRECSPDGRGVIWYREGDSQDLAHRAAFVARNSDFGRSLGDSGRLHVCNTHASHVVARRYDDIYKHAQSRRHDNLPKIPSPQLYTANVQV